MELTMIRTGEELRAAYQKAMPSGNSPVPDRSVIRFCGFCMLDDLQNKSHYEQINAMVDGRPELTMEGVDEWLRKLYASGRPDEEQDTNKWLWSNLYEFVGDWRTAAQL